MFSQGALFCHCLTWCFEYVGHEYVEEDAKDCEVMVHVGTSGRFLEMGPWCVSTTESNLSDTYQLVARKFFEVPLSHV
jgi:hypothetical protein